MHKQPELTASEVMGVDVDRVEMQKKYDQRYQDYAVPKFEAIYQNNRRICGLEAV